MLSFSAAAAVLALFGCVSGGYIIGTGRYDVTGPAAEIEMVFVYNIIQPEHVLV